MADVSCVSCGYTADRRFFLENGAGMLVCNGGPCWNAAERVREGNVERDF